MQRYLLFLLVAALVTACAEDPAEEQIARNIAAIQQAVEAKQFSEIEDYLHRSFLANGRLDITQVRGLLRAYGLQHRRLSVTIVSSATNIDPTYPDRAESTLSVITTGSSGRLPDDGSLRSVTVEWVEISGDWLIRKASW